MSTKTRAVVYVAAIVVALSAFAAFRYITAGGMTARQTPGSIEAGTARFLLNLSVPASAKSLKNPAAVTDASMTAGRMIYERKCEVCHAYDGGGKTDAGGGQYPPPLDLRGPEVTRKTDGELFYFIRNGIRNTAMPAWQMADQDIWQVVVFIRNLPKVVSASGQAPAANHASSSAQYVGSAACKSCHADIYNRWIKTPMANVVRDPKEHPDAIIPDLSKPNPLVTFTKEDIAFVYGSKWKQRYFKKVGDDYFPIPAQWDVTHNMWRPYKAAKGTDWWTQYYPDDNFQRPTGPLCDGCHSVNYDIAKKTVAEWNVGCEKCHGPGSEHVKNAVATNITNPARMSSNAAGDVCTQCHSQGQPLKNPIAGKYYDWPVGYEVGQRLSDSWKLEEHKLGEQTFTHFADGTAHKNRMQGNDFALSLMSTRGVTCFTCHDTHGTDNYAQLRKPANVLCLDCHGPTSPNGPHTASIEEHTHHKAGSPGNECVECHMPKIEATIADVSVRSHTFKFIAPDLTETLKVPNSCNLCHKDKSVQWAKDALRSWPQFSPWRVAQ